MANEAGIDRKIDLNLNIGEGFGLRSDVIEGELLPFVSSVNVATGAHTGDPVQIDKSIKRCKDYNVAIGALIAYPDLLGFGMRKIQLSNDELRASIISQLGSLTALARTHSYEISHVRAHGHLYGQLASNYSIAETVARAIQEFSEWIILVGPTSSVLNEVASWTNIRVAGEARIDLRYNASGEQLPFEPEKDQELDYNTTAERTRSLIYNNSVKVDGEARDVKIKFETIHIPNHTSNAMEAAKLIHGMVANPAALKSFDYEPYLSEFI